MTRFRSGLIAVSVLLAHSAAAGNLPCEPSPDCAMKVVRDLAMKSVKGADSDDDVIYSIQLLEWAQKQSPETEAAARARFAVLEKRVGKIGDAEERARASRWLGSSLAKAGLLPDAARIADRLDEDGRSVVYSNIAEAHARHDRWREAFLAADKVRTRDPRDPGNYFAVRGALKSVARTGNAEFIKEGVAMVKDAPPTLLETGLAWSDLAAGRDEAAVQRALGQSDSNWRMSVLFEISNWYQGEKRELDVLRVQRIQLEQMRTMKRQEWFDSHGKSYFDGLVSAKQYSQALEWAPEVRSEDLDMSLVGLFFDLRTPEDIARATKLLDLVSADRRYNAEKGLAWARIASGMVEPAAGFRSVAKPGEFARHAVELLRNFDPGLDERARSIIKAAVETVEAFPEKQPFGDLFYPRALAEAQIKFGLLEDARKTIDAMEYAGNRPEQLLMLSTAQSRAGQVDAARATKAEGLALLTRVGTPSREANSRAAILLRAEMLDEAEAELRRLMVPNPKPNFSNVTKKLIEALVKRGETKRAFQLAVDWSALDGDPEAVASFYGALTNTESPAGNLWRTLRKHYSG